MTDRRPLTVDETVLARSVFGDAVDYAAVRLSRTKWAFFQPRDRVMAPSGCIHFHPKSNIWYDDFAHAPLAIQGLFIHEMVMCLPKSRSGATRVSHGQGTYLH
ncbi:hypothetical protein [Sphingomonas aerophila]|uniref:Uncharacterized protein n=1 Tax=Sphingomonas aerophila TaxID=1344948 RepID=A0A7W9EWT0_9SPHN|nr:hypothetical protein [Sphingomonas aerophila]MBB5715868.1 hypothetical protein [Sphingomonas aerophila]